MDEELMKRLETLGVRRGLPADKPARPPSSSFWRVEKVIPGGRFWPDHSRSTFILEHIYPPDYQHGKKSLRISPRDRVYPGFFDGNPEINHEHLLFLDVETSSLSPGSGTLIFLVGLGYWGLEGYHSHQVFLNDPTEELSFLAYLDDWINRFPVLVTFNGRAFDLPVLNHRFLINGIRSKILEKPHVDVLHLARRLWRKRFPSRRLGFLENEVLGFVRDQNEIPSWMVPEIYQNYLVLGESNLLHGVFYHNEMDIVSLAGLFLYIESLFERPEWDRLLADEAYSLIREMEHQGHELLICFLQELTNNPRYWATNDPETAPLWLLVGRIYKRHGRIFEALQCWEKAANLNSLEACLELSRYHEHLEHNYRDALVWIDRAIAILDTSASLKEKRQFSALSRRRLKLLTQLARRSHAT
ncbi:ribonuclease H-like domain-containing protein [Thermanaerothrix daxensis]|uniref:ribonuclease H-like domain-containing protein n=1 Tax=Thermanaerothrix daxensis TaxID=869279 RepID=UPI0006C90730|nr:ribonuclease H-like domain-containing protein [Thermanaerothrix daxensis]